MCTQEKGNEDMYNRYGMTEKNEIIYGVTEWVKALTDGHLLFVGFGYADFTDNGQ